MPQFEVFALPDGQRVVDVQSDSLSVAQTRVVVPLASAADYPAPVHRLNPRFNFDADAVILATQQVPAVRARLLSEPIGSLAGQECEIKAAPDRLFSGF